MLLAGISIPTSGFLLQEYFQNPLAGPSVLGITSVASLCVAFYIFFSQDFILPEFLQNGFISQFGYFCHSSINRRRQINIKRRRWTVFC
jgi:ABC-type Fe3+-siderophore transport system permease subunit